MPRVDQRSKTSVKPLPPVDAKGLLQLVGKTPLLPLSTIQRGMPGVRLLAKAAWFNPGGSVKDRAAASIIAEVEASGRLTDGMALLDASSGNTAVAYAMIAAAKGYRTTLCVPNNANPQVIANLKAYRAELVFTDPLLGSDGAIREARRLAAAFPDNFLFVGQFNNPVNWLAGVLIGVLSGLMGIGGGVLNNTYMTLHSRPCCPPRGHR